MISSTDSFNKSECFKHLRERDRDRDLTEFRDSDAPAASLICLRNICKSTERTTERRRRRDEQP